MNAMSGLSARQQRVERLQRRCQAQINALGQARLVPVGARDGGPLVAQVATQQLPPWRQCTGHADRAVTGEGADLDDPLGAQQFDQQGHELALLRRDLHLTLRQPRGLLAQARQQW
jgi:hypothetical protein